MLRARAAGTLPPLPFLHFSWNVTEAAAGQRGAESGCEGEWEQHRESHVLPRAFHLATSHNGSSKSQWKSASEVSHRSVDVLGTNIFFKFGICASPLSGPKKGPKLA